jgi:hypothetical protein
MNENTRLYNCKDEELPIAGEMVVSSLKKIYHCLRLIRRGLTPAR